MEKIKKLYIALENNLLLMSIRQAFTTLIPIFLAGAFALAVEYFPITVVREFIATALDGKLYAILELIYDGTCGMSAIYLLIVLSFKYYSNITRRVGIGNILASIASVVSYVTLLGIKNFSIDGVDTKAILLNYTGVQGIFTALVTAALATRLFIFIGKLLYKKTDSRLLMNVDAYGAYRETVPIIATSLIFGIVSLAITALFKVNNLNELITNAFATPIESLGRTIWSGMLVKFCESIFWFFGVHGSNVYDAVNLKVFSEVSGEILTKSFFDVFVLMGGCGTLASLFIAVLLFSKSKQTRTLCRRSAVPLLFNINEVMVFGVPIVLNPVYFLPFVTTPVVVSLISYLAMSLGIVPPAVNAVQWTTPFIISGYLSTGSVAGSILQIFTLAIGTAIYTPFVILADRLDELKEHDRVRELVDYLKTAEANDEETTLIKDRNDYLSAFAEQLAYRLQVAIDKEEIEMFYKPQVDDSGRVIACESLLRWRYDGKNILYPPLVIKIAREMNIIKPLTSLILKKVIDDTKKLNELYGDKITVAMNLQADDMNLELINSITSAVKDHGVLRGTFLVELTEDSKLGGDVRLEKEFEQLGEIGVLAAVDDFSMGRTSLSYLQNSNFDYVKLDGGLVNNMLQNDRSRDIIASIVRLGGNLGFKVIAEYVETEAQRDALYDIGCKIYQGYLYSPALKFDDFVEYVNKTNGKEGA